MKIMPHELPRQQARDWDDMSFRDIEMATGINFQTIHKRCKRYGITKAKAVLLGGVSKTRRPLL